MKLVDTILSKLADLIRQGQFADLETEGIKIKPVPAEGGEWKERHKTINAFLNTRGGILISGRQGGRKRSGPALCFHRLERARGAKPEGNLEASTRIARALARICPIVSLRLNFAISSMVVSRSSMWMSWRQIENSFFTGASPTSAF